MGCGALGPTADRFASWLAQAGLRWWQMLPVGPPGYGNSPYSALSAFAGNPLLIGLETLEQAGLLASEPLPELPTDHVDYAAAASYRDGRLRQAFEAWSRGGSTRSTGPQDPAFLQFCQEQAGWLDDYVLFAALKEAHGGAPWTAWESGLRDRLGSALTQAREELRDELDRRRFEQWIFEVQWRRLRARCTSLGIGLIGDLPIFVAHDSADVWTHRDLFLLDDRGMPTVVAGVPPDYFSRTGQRWGNPLYRWDVLRADGYGWWIERLRQALRRFDAIRLDHFIGFLRCWEIPASDPTAERGRWVPGPGAHFFESAGAALGELPLIAEDLGAVSPEVIALRDAFDLPGIRILQFAFGTDPQARSFLPHNYPRHAAVYTGTHDNDTLRGWYTDPGGDESPRSPAQADKERRRALEYLGIEGERAASDVGWAMIRAVVASVANLAILPLQDVLDLGSEARMNRPGTPTGNWEWRCHSTQLSDALAFRLSELVRIYERGPHRGATP